MSTNHGPRPPCDCDARDAALADALVALTEQLAFLRRRVEALIDPPDEAA